MSLNSQSNIAITNFHLDTVPLGFKGIVKLIIKSNNIDELSIPMFVIKGIKPGKTIGVLGGVHGDEYDGPQAIRDIYTSLEPNELAGTFLGVPHSNIPAFSAGTRVSPIDGLNLARIFPGKEDGTITEKIANFTVFWLL